jgi:hypothetical protein
VGAGDRSGSSGCDGSRLSEFGDGRVQSIADDVVPTHGAVFQDAAEEVGDVGNVDCRPVLLSGAEHDQVALVICGRTEKQPGNRSAAVTGGDAGHNHEPCG